MTSSNATTRRPVQALVVHFVLKRHWANEMLAGRKDIEYRSVTPYWTARLTGREITHAAFSIGYTRRGRFMRPVTKIDIGSCPYKGWTGDFYRVHLGPIMPNAEPPCSPVDCRCGGEGQLFCWDDNIPGMEIAYSINCEDCDNEGPPMPTEADATAAWNAQENAKSERPSKSEELK